MLKKLQNISHTLKEDKDYLLAELLKQKQENVRLYSLLRTYSPIPDIIVKKLELEA